MNVAPANSPNKMPYSAMKPMIKYKIPPNVGKKLETKTVRAQSILQTIRTGKEPIFLERMSPNRIVRPIQIIIDG